MKNFTKVFFCNLFGLLVASSNLYALENKVESTELSPVVNAQIDIKDAKELAAILQSTKTYQANFKQSVFRDDATEADVTSGRFLIHRPNHFKWHTLHSYEQLIIADGDHLWTYDPDLEQVTIQNQNIVLTNSPLLLLTSGVEALVKAYKISKITNSELKEESELLFLLEPKENSLFETVHILIKDKNIVELFLTDALGSRTSVEFSDVIRNEKIDVSEFIFETPEGTDIVDSRESL
ncbi:MAG: outer membrane lipoprotein chaperone LolA [Kangiellaceae bacterium]